MENFHCSLMIKKSTDNGHDVTLFFIVIFGNGPISTYVSISLFVSSGRVPYAIFAAAEMFIVKRWRFYCLLESVGGGGGERQQAISFQEW